MKILVDSREQRPLPFPWPTERACLPCGDYGCILDGEEMVPLVFERKSVSDLFGTLSGGYERFRRMLKKARAEDIRVVVCVEGNLRKILRGYSRSQRSGQSIVRQLFTIRAVYGVDVIFFQDREEMAKYILDCFDAYKRLRAK